MTTCPAYLPPLQRGDGVLPPPASWPPPCRHWRAVTVGAVVVAGDAAAAKAVPLSRASVAKAAITTTRRKRGEFIVGGS
ncbi:MAG TPA: hypothetical protein VGH89_30115 [Pseudonocardia sp.]